MRSPRCGGLFQSRSFKMLPQILEGGFSSLRVKRTRFLSDEHPLCRTCPPTLSPQKSQRRGARACALGERVPPGRLPQPPLPGVAPPWAAGHTPVSHALLCGEEPLPAPSSAAFLSQVFSGVYHSKRIQKAPYPERAWEHPDTLQPGREAPAPWVTLALASPRPLRCAPCVSWQRVRLSRGCRLGSAGGLVTHLPSGSADLCQWS